MNKNKNKKFKLTLNNPIYTDFNYKNNFSHYEHIYVVFAAIIFLRFDFKYKRILMTKWGYGYKKSIMCSTIVLLNSKNSYCFNNN